MKRSGYQTNPSGQGGVQHSDAAQAPGGLSGSGGLLYSQIAASNALSSNTEVVWSTQAATLAPGTLSAGAYVHYNAWGYYTVAVGTPVLEIDARLYPVGSFVGLGLLSVLVVPVAPNGVSFVNWRVESGFTVRSVGSSGSFVAEPGRNFYNRDTNLTLPTVTSLYVGLQTPFPVNTGTGTYLAMSAKWTPSDPANQVVMIGSEAFVDYPASTS